MTIHLHDAPRTLDDLDRLSRPRCRTCAFFSRSHLDGGFCHRNAPAAGQPTPTTTEYGFCGEYVALDGWVEMNVRVMLDRWQHADATERTLCALVTDAMRRAREGDGQ